MKLGEYSQFARQSYSLSTVDYTEFAVDMVDVLLYSADTDMKLGSYFLVGETFCNENQ